MVPKWALLLRVCRWQHYNTEREKYVQQLQLKLKESEESLASAANKTQISEEQQRQIDRLIQEHKKKFHDLEDAKIKVNDCRTLCPREGVDIRIFVDTLCWIH